MAVIPQPEKVRWGEWLNFERMRAGQRFDFFAFLRFFGIIFLAAFLTELTADLAATRTRLVTDFFFDFLAIGFSLAFSSERRETRFNSFEARRSATAWAQILRALMALRSELERRL